MNGASQKNSTLGLCLALYALIRGSIIGSYPYPFIDAAALGYGRTMRNAFGLLFVFIALGYLFVALSRRASHRVRT